MSQNNRLLIPNADVWPKASDWLIRDEFTDTVAAGSVNGTAATPGPGNRTGTDTESKLSVGGGVLAIAGGKASPAWGDPGIWYGAQTRAAGLAYITKTTIDVTTNSGRFGWMTAASGNASGSVLMSGAGFGAFLSVATNAATISAVYPIVNSTAYEIAVVTLTAGALYFVKNSGTWELLWRSASESTATIYPSVQSFNIAPTVDYLRVIALPAPFDTDDGLATDTLAGSVAAGTTFSHEENALIEATITTVPSADNIDIVFRQQDASNYWICRIATGGDISLQEVVAGSPTQRGTAAGVVSNGHRVVVIADGTTIKGYSNNVLRWTYSSATNFATATAGEVLALGTGGAVSNLKTWPRTLSGTAASILNKVSA